MKLVSVNIGKAEHIPGHVAPTGILKHPVSGPVAIGPEGLEGDAVMDKKHHGGVDQAVYLYLQSDYDWWKVEEGEDLAPGTFGENLVIDELASDSLAVGDRFTIGNVLMEVTSHREPCATLAARMGDSKWVRRFHRSHRPGAYLRVLEPGTVEAGMAVSYAPYSGATVTLRELVDTMGERQIDPAFMRRALEAPIHWKMHRDFVKRLGALDQGRLDGI